MSDDNLECTKCGGTFLLLMDDGAPAPLAALYTTISNFGCPEPGCWGELQVIDSASAEYPGTV